MRQRSNLLSQVQNGQFTKKESIEVPFSKFSRNFLQLLQEDGFISHWTLIKKTHLTLKVFYKKQSLAQKQIRFSLKIISKPSRPFTVSLQSLYQRPKISTYIISTSRGLITDRQAREFRLGGELICIISIY